MEQRNSITCEIGGDGASRWAHFMAGEWCYCKVSQSASAITFTLLPCRFSWLSDWTAGDTIAEAVLHTEAMLQAIELARKWDKDAGKPYKEVLQQG